MSSSQRSPTPYDSAAGEKLIIETPEQTSIARDEPGIACAKQWRAFIAGGEVGEFGDDGGAGIVDRHARGCGVRRRGRP